MSTTHHDAGSRGTRPHRTGRLDRRAAAVAIEDTGTDEEVWRHDEQLHSALPQRLPDGPVVVVAAHPDDEVLGFGGSIAMLTAAGQPVHTVCLTDGEASHPHRAHDGRRQLAVRRRAELSAALGKVGPVNELVHAGLPDTALDTHEDRAARVLTDTLRARAPRVCVAPWDQDLHSDHEAAGRAAARACRRTGTRLWFYPVWMWHWARPGDTRVRWDALRLLPLTREAQERKRAAVACFASQLRPRDAAAGLGPVLPPEEMAHHTRAFETVIR